MEEQKNTVSGMTPDQMQAAVIEDPEKFWRHVATASMEIIETNIEDMQKKFSSGLAAHLGQLRSVLLVQMNELILYRTLEVHIKNQSLTDEVLKDIFEKLEALRVAARSSAVE